MQFRKEYESQNDTLKISLYNIKHTVHTYVYALLSISTKIATTIKPCYS